MGSERVEIVGWESGKASKTGGAFVVGGIGRGNGYHMGMRYGIALSSPRFMLDNVCVLSSTYHDEGFLILVHDQQSTVNG